VDKPKTSVNVRNVAAMRLASSLETRSQAKPTFRKDGLGVEGLLHDFPPADHLKGKIRPAMPHKRLAALYRVSLRRMHQRRSPTCLRPLSLVRTAACTCLGSLSLVRGLLSI
jgi:hypothetical protein